MVLRRVVVTGLGALTPIGNNIEEYWNSLLTACVQHQSLILMLQNLKLICMRTKNFNAEDFLDQKLEKWIATQYAMVSSEEAVNDAGFNLDTLDKDRAELFGVQE
jgi:3-oxoacyl-[acyl-carrier-protein] synthase II